MRDRAPARRVVEGIDPRLLDAYIDWSGEEARRGILHCETQREGESVEQWIARQLREVGRLPEGWE